MSLTGRPKVDLRLTPESLPLLLDVVSSQDQRMAETALFALMANGAQIAHDETETSDATLYRITLPDGSVHEQPINSST